MKHIRNIFFLLAFVFAATGCYKDPALTYEESDMTITHYNQYFDFTTYSNFIMPDSTILKTNYLSEEGREEFYEPGGTGELTRELLRDKFVSIGYNEVTDIEDADFIALPVVVLVESTEIVYYNPGWYWGYPGYGWGWGYYKSTDYYYGWYPVYPYYPVGVPVEVSTFDGTIAYVMVDAASYQAMIEWIENNPDEDFINSPIDLEAHWESVIEGSITEDAEYNQERAIRGTDEAFAQSPYLLK